MLRQTVSRLAEFKQKSRWSKVRPPMRYGAMFLMWGPGRTIPFMGVHWVTRDSNRLTLHPRYEGVLNQLDMTRNEEEFKVVREDVRWMDHRRLWFKCATCGTSYRKAVSSKVKFHANCPRCKLLPSSEVLGTQAKAPMLKDSLPDATAKIVAADPTIAANLSSLPVTSKFIAEWSCEGCQAPFRMSVRMRTGKVLDGQCPVTPLAPVAAKYCDSCRWGKLMGPAGEQAKAENHYVGVGSTTNSSTKGSSTPLRRRKRLVNGAAV